MCGASAAVASRSDGASATRSYVIRTSGTDGV